MKTKLTVDVVNGNDESRGGALISVETQCLQLGALRRAAVATSARHIRCDRAGPKERLVLGE